jgi:alkanesulfonate monooxygenase SsuD/methylene tetrahydromethanopterin reductase-like flavin-dependent oxidoreductase (luciferase family)
MPSFGIMTAPMQVDYHDILRVWREADAIDEIEHAWLFDPPDADRRRPERTGLRGLDAAVGPRRTDPTTASGTSRDQQPLPAPPAMLAKIAATVDVVSGGRLDFGIGAGSRPSHPLARREYEGHGLPFHDFAHSVGSLAEACTVIRRLWTSPDPFDFDGDYVHLAGAFGNPKPVQRPYPPIVIGGRSSATLRVVAEHADVWNIPGGDLEDAVSRSTLLDRYCTEIGRDPAAVTRSMHLQVSYDQPRLTRDAIGEAVDAGFPHIVLGLPAPYPAGVARWVADELIAG